MASKSIFYSWQSDTPANLNRSFIEKAIRDALLILKDDTEVLEAMRDQELTIDKDTSGVPGSPPIAQTILNKIDLCSVFIADLTFVGESADSLKRTTKRTRRFPNPNVLIEYGYALKTHSHVALVAVVNKAFGGELDVDLPFDLKHMRWPIQYELADASDPNKSDKQKRLSKQLAEALRPILLADQSTTNLVSLRHDPEPATDTDPAVFCTLDRDLIPERHFQSEFVPFSIIDEGRLFFRMYPLHKVERIRSSLEAVNLVNQSRLRPVGRNVRGWDTTRNRFGAIIHEALTKGKLYNFTQLFNSWELWGMDGFSVNKSAGSKFTEGRHPGYIPSQLVEQTFVCAAINFLAFYKQHMPKCREFGVRCGLSGITGYPIAHGRQVGGQSFANSIIWDAEVTLGQETVDIWLKPFFEKIWEECGVHREVAAEEHLKKFAEAEEQAYH